jgi:K(+)-stimulated pyrophosphate-energized sodium pump
MGNILYYLLGVSLLGMAYSFWKYYQIDKLEAASLKSSQIAAIIKKGSLQFMVNEYKVLILFAFVLGILLFFKGQADESSNGFVALSYIIGAGISALAGYLGLYISTKSNIMTANECRISYSKGFQAATSGSAAIGLANASLLVFGLVALFIAYHFAGRGWNTLTLVNVMSGFALGASSFALFARYGGGLFSKSTEMADARLQDIEAGIKTNSTYSPTSSATEVGQNIGNIKGLGADIFDSFAATLIAAMILGVGFTSSDSVSGFFSTGPLLVPIALAAAGILTSAGGMFALKANSNPVTKQTQYYVEGGVAVVLAVVAFFVTKFLLPQQWDVVHEAEKFIHTTTYFSLGIFWCALFGIVASVSIGQISTLIFNTNTHAIKATVRESTKGTDSGILAGIQNGLITIGLPVGIVLVVTILSYYYAGYYGLGIAATGFLANMGFYNALAAIAPIADNSNSIAQKADMGDETIAYTLELKKTGIRNLVNSRNFMLVGASLTVLTILGAFILHSGIGQVNLSKPLIIAGVILGAILPFILSSTVLSSLSKIKQKMIAETKRQFNEIEALSEAKEILNKYNGDLTFATVGEKEIVYASVDDVDHKRLVEMASYETILETIIPGTIAIALVAVLGYFTGSEILAGFLIGMVTSGILLSFFFANSGHISESTKTAFEEGVDVYGEIQGTNTPGYKTAVIADKTGKPMKDAISPAIFVVMKMALIAALVLSSTLVNREQSKKGLHIQNFNKAEIQVADNK